MQFVEIRFYCGNLWKRGKVKIQISSPKGHGLSENLVRKAVIVAENMQEYKALAQWIALMNINNPVAGLKTPLEENSNG